MTQEEIDSLLISAADEKFREFNRRIVNTKLDMLGVRAPYMQTLAKKIAKEPCGFFDWYIAENYEQILLYGLTLAVSKMPLEEKYPYLEKFLSKLENWAHVDMTLGAFKQLGKHADEFAERYEYLAEGTEFERRFLAVFLMDYCLTEEKLNKVFALYEKMQCDYYYVNMAIAWGLSVALVKFYDQTVEFIKRGTLSEFVLKKTVQKARESYRISPERKAELKKLITA